MASSETRIDPDKGTNFELDGYEFSSINRTKKNGGGVAMFVDKELNYKVLECLTTVVDNVLESLTTEICTEKNSNIIMSWIYRAPGSSTEPFRDRMEEIYSKISRKVLFICGDFNIDLLNPNQQKND